MRGVIDKIEDIEASETYLYIKNKTTKINSERIAIKGAMAKNIPIETATPLPPLNLRYNGNICPNTIAKAAIKESFGSIFELVKKYIGKNALDTSKTRVIIPRESPFTRATLVAPIFPLPILRGSWQENIFEIIRPLGIDPIRYEIDIRKNKYITVGYFDFSHVSEAILKSPGQPSSVIRLSPIS